MCVFYFFGILDMSLTFAFIFQNDSFAQVFHQRNVPVMEIPIFNVFFVHFDHRITLFKYKFDLF